MCVALHGLTKHFIPNKDITVRPEDLPWYNSSLRYFKRKVMRAKQVSLKSKSPRRHITIFVAVIKINYKQLNWNLILN